MNVVKEISFKTATIEHFGHKTVLCLDPVHHLVKSQFPLNDGVVEFYSDGTISVYAYEVQYREMWGGESYWMKKKNQDFIPKICSDQIEEVSVEYGFIGTLLNKIFNSGEVVKYKRAKPNAKKNLRLKSYKDFKMDFLHGNDLVIRRGRQRKPQ